MISIHRFDKGRTVKWEAPLRDAGPAVWIDLVTPTRDEERHVELATGVAVPTLDEMTEIESSSRIYEQDGALFLTALVLANTEADNVVISPVTFVLAGERLITVRYHKPKAFQQFSERSGREGAECTNASRALMLLLESIVDRLADILERGARDIDALSGRIFGFENATKAKGRGFEHVLVDLGRKGNLASNIRDSLATLERVCGFLALKLPAHDRDKGLRERLKTLLRDIRSLSDHTSFLSQKITFLLDATLGLINIEQNNIIKIFSIAAVVFLPPTLVASIYGMNFQFMPELHWAFGYPAAIGTMVVSAVLPIVYFKRMGWL